MLRELACRPFGLKSKFGIDAEPNRPLRSRQGDETSDKVGIRLKMELDAVSLADRHGLESHVVRILFGGLDGTFGRKNRQVIPGLSPRTDFPTRLLDAGDVNFLGSRIKPDFFQH